LRRAMTMEKKPLGRGFDPARYRMDYCPGCNGSGRSSNGAEGMVVCRICGGFGLIKREKESNFECHRVNSEPNRDSTTIENKK